VSTLEGIGDAVTGSVLARTVEPRTGDAEASPGPDGHTHEHACLNCGTRLRGEFCHGCGQHAHVHRTLGAFGHDLLHGVLHLEGKIWRTLPTLMFRPGELTRRYIAGERARFVSPLAMFLFSVFLMFAVMSFLGSPMDMLDADERGEMTAEMQREMGEMDGRLDSLRRQRAEAVARGASTAELDDTIRGVEMARDIVGGIGGGSDAPAPNSDSYKADHAVGKALAGRSADGKAQDADRTGLTVQESAGSPTRKVNVGSTQVIGFQPDSGFDTLYKAAKKNPKLLVYKLQTNAYKFSWALIIISVPFVALLFLWRWRPLYDHTVFVTYSITAVSILVIVGSLLILAGVPAGPVWGVGSLFVPWHMYRQLRGGYGLRRFSALWRTFLLAIFASVALSLFAFMLVALGVLG